MQVYQRLEEIDAYTAEARASAILAGLSFDAAAQGRATKTFSGGWRMRVALARWTPCTAAAPDACVTSVTGSDQLVPPLQRRVHIWATCDFQRGFQDVNHEALHVRV